MAPDCNQQQLSPKHAEQGMESPVDFTMDHEMINRAPSFERPAQLRQDDFPGSRPNDNRWRIAREESEAVASNLQKEMEAKITAMGEENFFLIKELEILGYRLQKQMAEYKACKSQSKSWKSKLGKVKTFLNELGTDYQNLRGEAIHFKATRKTLEKERREIAESIEDVKSQMSKISQTCFEGRGEADCLISSLKQELKRMREMNCSRAQDKRLDEVKAKQLEVMERLESEFKVTSKKYKLSHTTFNGTFEKKVDDFLNKVSTTTHTLFNDKMDMQQCREKICTFQSRIDTATRQLGEDIVNHSKIAEGLLSASEDCCNSLRLKLEEAAPAIEKFGVNIGKLQIREVDLRQRMETLETRLSEVKLPERFEDDYFHISEKLGLGNEAQNLTLSLNSTEEKLKVQQFNSVQTHDELREMTAKSREGTLAQKEEYQALRKELEGANDDAQNSLESGNQKAKTETHSLLKRIQDSESGMKMVSETLHRMNVAHLQQPLSETSDQLVRMLQANNAKPTVGQERSPVRISETSARDKNTQMKHGARHIEAQTDTIADGTKTPTNHSNPSKQTGSIVPYSSIVQGLSPVRYAVAGNGPFDLSALTQTQERATSLQEPTVPARPEKRNSLTETAPGSKRQGANIEVHYIVETQQL
ncbi:hypothetical protein BDW71DRAFT_205542 [Aspergillus fruticulosus]